MLSFDWPAWDIVLSLMHKGLNWNGLNEISEFQLHTCLRASAFFILNKDRKLAHRRTSVRIIYRLVASLSFDECTCRCVGLFSWEIDHIAGTFVRSQSNTPTHSTHHLFVCFVLHALSVPSVYGNNPSQCNVLPRWLLVLERTITQCQ